MAKPTMTAEVKRSAEMLYIAGHTNVADIARMLKVNRDSLYYWIRQQDWYKTVPSKSRLAKQLEKMDLSFSDADFDHHKRKDADYNIVFPFQLPSMNEFIAAINQSRFQGNKFKHEVEERMIPFIRAAMPAGKTFNCKVKVHLTFYEASDKRDFDNIISSQKFVFDALQSAGVIERDDQAHLLPPSFSFGKDARPHTVVSVYPHPECPVQPVTRYYVPRKKKKDDSWRDMYGEEEIRTAYKMAADKSKQFKIFLDFGVPKSELKKILGV